MEKGIYSVYDSKSGVFSTPFFSYNNSTALRDFTQGVNDRNSQLAQFPSDYTLFRVGTFDDLNGTVVPESVLVNLGLAEQYRNKEA